MPDTTLFNMSGNGVPPYSARGLTQSLEPIAESASMRRTINGHLKDLSASQFRKYQSTVNGQDQQPPAVAGVWPGQIVTVDCVAELCYKTAGGSPERDVVATRTEGDFTFYRPRLTMRVVSFTNTKDEYPATDSWSMQLEEV